MTTIDQHDGNTMSGHTNSAVIKLDRILKNGQVSSLVSLLH